jgi:hypothetical protein
MTAHRPPVPGSELAHGYDSDHGHDRPLHGMALRLAPDQLVELADLVAERLQRVQQAPAPPASAPCLVNASTVAEAIGMSAPWVREHAAELGGQRMGDGPRPRLRFDLEKARAAWAARSASERPSVPDSAPQPGSRRRRSTPSGSSVPLLPVRGAEEVRRAA